MTKSTKQLAKELGFLRKRSSSLQTRQERQTKAIEFPAVLLNTQNGQIESEFHFYIQPQENPILSEFCTELTGIKQDKVDQGIPLCICLKKFGRWLKEISEQHNFVYNMTSVDVQPRCTFVTWSDWDLGVCLHYETRRKQLRKPAELNSWIDLRATYRAFYQRRPKGLNGALQDLGLTFEGREHSGIVDARNTARLAYRMICDGCVLNITKTMSGPDNRSTLVSLIVPNQQSLKQTGNNNALEVPEVGGQSHVTKNGSTPTSNEVPRNYVTYSNVRTASFPKQTSINSEEDNLCDTNSKSCLQLRDRETTSLVVMQRANLNSTNRRPSAAKRRGSAESANAKRGKPRGGSICAESGDSAGTGSKTATRVGLKDVTNAGGRRESSLASQTNLRTNGFVSAPRNAHRFGAFKTPFACSPRPASSRMKRTPPLCSCGHRAKRRTVQKPCPNLGRVFFCCGADKSRSRGCGFFKWESVAPGTDASPALATRATTARADWLPPKPTEPMGQPDFGTPQPMGNSRPLSRP